MAARVRSGQVRVELLGAFRVVVDGVGFTDTVWPSRRSAELVQLLALSERRCLQRDQVIEALWAHLEPEAGAANLRKAAHHARQALDRADAVMLSGGRVALFPSDEVATDVDCFEQMAEAALRSRDGVACAEAASRYAMRSGRRPGGTGCDRFRWSYCDAAGSGTGWWRSNRPTSRPTGS